VYIHIYCKMRPQVSGEIPRRDYISYLARNWQDRGWRVPKPMGNSAYTSYLSITTLKHNVFSRPRHLHKRMVSFKLRPLNLQLKDPPVPSGQVTKRTPKLVWAWWIERIQAPTGTDNTLTVQPVARPLLLH
jgi:hypothetical protein